MNRDRTWPRLSVKLYRILFRFGIPTVVTEAVLISCGVFHDGVLVIVTANGRCLQEVKEKQPLPASIDGFVETWNCCSLFT